MDKKYHKMNTTTHASPNHTSGYKEKNDDNVFDEAFFPKIQIPNIFTKKS